MLLSTATILQSIRGKPQFQHDYVVRGSAKQKATFNSLTVPEYGWALLRMLKDTKIDAVNKPRILAHLFNVLEDAKDFNWCQVREWSEEVYCQLAQKENHLWDDAFE